MKILLTLLGFVLLVFIAIWWINPNLHYNIHPVIKSKVYRSAELPKDILENIVKKHKIRSIINLRNAHPTEKWYQDEVLISKENHTKLYNLALPAFNKPTRQELITLTNTISRAKRPILIHCRHGADRTGLASAIVLILRNVNNTEEIERQASWHYLAISPKSVGKIVLPAYVKWLDCHNLLSSKKQFQRWLRLPNFLNINKVCRAPIA